MYKLLVADDEKKIREGICALCDWNKLGFEIVACMENGKQILEYITRNKVDVLLTDICMPYTDGIQIAKYIYEHHLELKVIFLSGYSDFELARKAIKYSVTDYIIKPVTYKEIFMVFTHIRELLDQRSDPRIEKVRIDSSLPAIISQIQKYVHNNFSEASLDGAAMEVGLSPNYISKLFKQHTNVFFSDYILSVKMENACKLLQDVKLKIYEVALMCGYDNPKNFAKIFKQYKGVTPQVYRKGNFEC